MVMLNIKRWEVVKSSNHAAMTTFAITASRLMSTVGTGPANDATSAGATTSAGLKGTLEPVKTSATVIAMMSTIGASSMRRCEGRSRFMSARAPTG